MFEKLWRNSVRDMDPYIPGKSIEELKREQGIVEITRLGSNENPIGPSPKAIIAMKKAVEESHLYPDSTYLDLRSKLGELDGLDPEQYVVANGADNIIKLIGNAYINPSDEVVYCTPTFTAYKSIVLLMGGIPVEVPSCANYDIDLEAMYNAINEKTKLVVIVNPNNPTGTIANKEELRSFLNRIPEHVIVVLDEAYIDYVETKDYPTGIDFIKEGFSVISIRTFSKLYGLAGIRVGYAVASKELLLPVQRVREVFSCNRVASAGAIAALEDKEHKLKVLKENKSEKVRLVEGLRRLGYEVTNSYTNFLFVNMLRDTTEISTTLFRMGLIIRPCAPWGLSTHARITVGTKEQNDKLIYALQNLDEAAVKGC